MRPRARRGVDPQKKFLFASLRTNSTLASFGIDPATGKLKLHSTAQLPKGENAAFVGTDRTGRWLVSASYNAGKVVVHRLNDDGTIQTPAVQTVETAKTAHSFATDRDNRFVFVPPGTQRQVRAGDEGLTFVCVGAPPGRPYVPRS